MALEKGEFLELVDEQRRAGRTRLINASLRGANLAGLELSECALPSADLSGADLTGARLARIDFTLANLQGARLEGASLNMVNAAGATLTGAKAAGAYFEHVQFSHADLSKANLSKALIGACTFESAVLDEALLRHTHLVHSNCREASFRGAKLNRVVTIGSVFDYANFNGARGFYRSPEIVMEVLRREAGKDFELIKAIGAIGIDRNRCYAEWREYLADHPDQNDFALRVFALYPASGCLEALRGEIQHTEHVAETPTVVREA